MIAPILAAAALAAGPDCATGAVEIPTWRGPSVAHQRQLLGEAEAFMADYARLLLAGDRAALAALYDPDGAILVRNGTRIEASQADIVERYRNPRWQPPASFSWPYLRYEVAGAETVVVIGEFTWGDGDGPPVTGTYHALLRREDGRLYIRIEDEWLLRSDR